MKLKKEDVLNEVYLAIDEVNATLPDGEKLARNAETIIFGPEHRVDSLILVSLVMAAEQNIYENLGVEVLLASENAMSRKNSPYRCADSLAEYALEMADKPVV